MGVKNDSTLVFNKYRVIFDPPLDGEGLIKVVVSDSNTGILQVYNDTCGLLKTVQAHKTGLPINRIKQLPNGYVATCSNDFTAKIWDPTTWIVIQNYTGHTSGVVALEYINTDTMASSAYDQTIQIWSMSTGVTIRKFTNVQNQFTNVLSLALLTNGYYLASGLASGIILIYNINNESLVFSLQGHTTQVNDLVLLDSNDLLASSSSDNTVRIWNLAESNNVQYEIVFNLTGHSSSVQGLKLVSSDLLASGSSDNTVILWNITTGTLYKTLTGHKSGIMFTIDTSDLKTFFSASYDLKIKQWESSTGILLNSCTTSLAISALAVLNEVNTITTTLSTTTGFFNFFI
jgi:WD40 repeat protein